MPIYCYTIFYKTVVFSYSDSVKWQSNTNFPSFSNIKRVWTRIQSNISLITNNPYSDEHHQSSMPYWWNQVQPELLSIKQIVCPHRVLHFYKIASGLPLLGDRYVIINVMIFSLVDVDNSKTTTPIDTSYCIASSCYFWLPNDLPFLWFYVNDQYQNI